MKAKQKKYILDHFRAQSVEHISRTLGMKERSVSRFIEQIEKDHKTEVRCPEVPAIQTLGRKKIFLSVALLTVLGAAVYFRALGNEFVWDDKLLIENNPHIESVKFIPQIFHEDLFYMSETTGYYRPLQTLSYVLDRALFGGSPVGYHAMSVFFQILNAVLVFFLGLLLIGRMRESLFIAALFCVHPAFVPIVAYVSGRADLLGFFFGLLSLYLSLRLILKDEKKFTAPAVIAYTCAALSKEFYLVVPFFVLLYAVVFKRPLMTAKKVLPFFIGFALVASGYILLRGTWLNFHQDMGVIAKQSFLTRLALFPYLLTNYVLMLFMPLRLGMEKALSYSSLFEGRFIASYAGPVLLGWLAWRFNQEGEKLKLFFLLWFCVAMLPLTNLLFPLKAIFADHWTYWASLGFFGILVIVLFETAERFSDNKRAQIVLPVLFVLFFSAVTVHEIGYWKNEDVFFNHILERNPNDSRTIFNLGKVFEEKGDNAKALQLFDRSIDLSRGRNAFFIWTRAQFHRKAGRPELALTDFERAVELSPHEVKFLNDLGAMYAERGMLDKAREQWENVLKIDPKNDLVRRNLQAIGELAK